MKFELTNEQRKYLGLKPVQDNWDKVQLTDNIYIYFEGDTIKKQISFSNDDYHEVNLDEKTRNREILLPKTNRGKEKKLNFSSLQSRKGIGVYFCYHNKSGGIIANYSTQTTFYRTDFESIKIKNFNELSKWLDFYIKSSTENDLKEIEKYKNAKRKKVKYQEGDFFTFKVDRRNYGFGRILLDIGKLREQDDFKKKPNYGLNHIFGKPLVISIYHKISPSKEINLNELKMTKSCPSQYIMDNPIFYGEYEIIGNLQLEQAELEYPISYSKSISYKDIDAVYIQWGQIYKETRISKFQKYLSVKYPDKNGKIIENPYRHDGASFVIQLDKLLLEKCIKTNSNKPYWNNDWFSTYFDLRNPANEKIKTELFKQFGLSPNLNYSDNLNKQQKLLFKI